MRRGEKHQNTVPVRAMAILTIVSAMFILCTLGCQRSSSTVLEKPASSADSSSSSVVAEKPAPVETPAPEKDKSTVQAVDEQQPSVAQSSVASPLSASPPSGEKLYALHCAACHSKNGDGKGIATAFLFPKPRDFRAGRFRLVSTSNNVPTREDLHAVLLRGMPGSSMPPWKHLEQKEREALVDEVLRLRKEGARESYANVLKEEEELTEEELADEEVQKEIQDYVRDFTTPGESTVVPVIESPDKESIARGRDIYIKQNCHSCHGKDGRGDGVEKMVDGEGFPTSPRDFTLGIFKGGHDGASLFRRVAYGMPGTPMPSSNTLPPADLVDLVHFIRSLSSEESRLAAMMNRTKIIVKAVNTMPEPFDSNAWEDFAPVNLRVLPLWWRNDADPNLQVQAIHDGKSIAVRLSWNDQSQDEHATQSESFEDAVAMELYRGEAEPFLGMGSADHSVDVWFWDADRQTAIDVEDQYPNIVADIYPFSEKVVATAEYHRKGTSQAEQPKISLPALAVGNQIVPTGSKSGGTDLAVGGPGSVTFRIPKNQLVNSVGQWKEGRWTVEMRRALAVESPDEGVSLLPGEKASVALAVWNGSHRDRDGQKLITIWQDLELEK
jgi:mono/diheme cytochrome c family protein